MRTNLSHRESWELEVRKLLKTFLEARKKTYDRRSNKNIEVSLLFYKGSGDYTLSI